VPAQYDASRKSYLEEGYLVVRGLISPSGARTLLDDYLRAVRGEIFVPTWPEHLRAKQLRQPAVASDPRGEELFMQLAHPSDYPPLRHWRDHPCYQRSLALARALCPAEGLFFSYDQCFYKPGGSTAVVYPHQDAAYWHRMGITAWVALTRVTREMAPVQYYPNTHQRVLPHVEAPRAWNGVKDFAVEPGVLREVAAPLVFDLEAGDCVFHSSLTVHGSGPNLSSRPRCGLALHYMSRQPVT
jgi:ectoine hydroxylase-related dioxygenase (phytanoyl-CoA dioxygenase family)